VSEDANNGTEPVRKIKPPSIFISKLSNPPSLRQLLNKIANDKFDLKNINAGNFKIQIKSSIAYTNIVKEVKSRNIKFHIYKPKQKRSSKVILKHMLLEKKMDAIKRDIKELGHKITNIWNIKNHGTKVPLNMFYIELKPENNNKDIYEATHMLG